MKRVGILSLMFFLGGSVYALSDEMGQFKGVKIELEDTVQFGSFLTNRQAHITNPHLLEAVEYKLNRDRDFLIMRYFDESYTEVAQEKRLKEEDLSAYFEFSMLMREMLPSWQREAYLLKVADNMQLCAPHTNIYVELARSNARHARESMQRTEACKSGRECMLEERDAYDAWILAQLSYAFVLDRRDSVYPYIDTYHNYQVYSLTWPGYAESPEIKEQRWFMKSYRENFSKLNLIPQETNQYLRMEDD